MDESETLTLASIRDSLIRQEDSIIFSLIERAQYKTNNPTYDADRFSIPGFQGSLVEFILKETESLHAKVHNLICLYSCSLFKSITNIVKEFRALEPYASHIFSVSYNNSWTFGEKIMKQVQNMLKKRLNLLSAASKL